jgi:NSS family neurotransmitter:Na+ symporter
MSGDSREHWTGRTGFVLAAVGSAVGLGNMWRFSYLTAEQGGAAFVLLYLLFTALVGLPVMLAEFSIGRGAQRSPIQALGHYGGPRWRWLGGVFVLAGFVILSYYSVIAGWAVRYGVEAALFGFPADASAYFSRVSEGWDAFAYHAAFMALSVIVVRGGVKDGIERAASLMMPALFFLVVGIALYAATLEGASRGYAYYLNVDFSKITDWNVVVSAAGQAFFSLSIGMGVMLTFASYLTRDHDLPGESLLIAVSDFGVAFVAGFMVFPVIFALGLQSDVIGADTGTIGALFIALPKAFATMGDAGRIVGVCFFAALIVGALTSAISLLEVVVSAAIDGLGWGRGQAAVRVGIAIGLLGTPSALGIAFLDAMDTVANQVLLIGGGLGLAVFTGYVMRDPLVAAREGSGGFDWTPVWLPLLRYGVPVILGAILLSSIPATWSKLVALF